MIKRYGDVARPKTVYRRRPGVYAILLRDGEILTTFQSEPKAEFQLPGGGIDQGESPISALHREVMEETGWHIAKPWRLGAFRRFTFMPEYDFWAEKVCAVYLARPVLKISGPTEAGHRAVWMNPGVALRVLSNDGDRAMLQLALRRQHLPK